MGQGKGKLIFTKPGKFTFECGYQRQKRSGMLVKKHDGDNKKLEGCCSESDNHVTLGTIERGEVKSYH